MDCDSAQVFEYGFTHDTSVALLRVRKAATGNTFGVSAPDFKQFVTCLNSVFISYLLVIYNLYSLHAMGSP